MALLPLWDLRQLVNSALVTTGCLVLISGYKLMQQIRAYYFVLLGYGVMAFLDVWKHNFFFNSHYELRPNYDWAIYWTYVSCLIFLLSYQFGTIKIKVPQVRISHIKTKFIALPLSVAFLVFYLLYQETVNVFSTFHSVLVLVSFIPKACAVLMFYLFVRYRKWEYLLWFIVLLSLSFTEGTRRVYITMFLVCLAIGYAHIIKTKGRIYGRYKVMALISFIGIFFYMNFLRADMDIGEGYEEGAEFNNTINYMMQLTALDTYDNTAYLLSNFPSKYDYYYGETYAALFVQFIPRSLWEGKPVGLGGPLGLLKNAGIREFTKAKWVREARGISYSPGFIGEAYANFGVIGIFILSILFGLGTKFFDSNVRLEEVLENPVQMANTAWYGSFFLLLRGDMVMALYYSALFYLFLRMWLVFLEHQSPAGSLQESLATYEPGVEIDE
jgi:oligosaccharide repeat unit polymerase